jgi:hypothetical protein
MTETTRVTVRIIGDREDDAEEITRLARRLRTVLLELDVDDVEPVAAQTPGGAKGIGEALGWLYVTFGGELLKAIADQVVAFALSSRRTIEIEIDGDKIKLDHATREQQDELYRIWLARHTSRPSSPERGYL